MSRQNPLWDVPRIHGELLKLGIEVSEATVSIHGAPQIHLLAADIHENPDDLMAKQGATRDRPNPWHCPSIKLVNLTGHRSSGFHQGQRLAYRSEKAGYMTASSTAVSNQIFPCITGGVHT